MQNSNHDGKTLVPGRLIVTIALLALVSLTGLGAWAMPAPNGAQANAATAEETVPIVQVDMLRSAARIDTGDLVTVTLHVSEEPAVYNGIYAASYVIHFDPALLQVQDANDAREGVQIQSAGIFAGRSPFEVTNLADNVSGLITYTVSVMGTNAAHGPGDLGEVVFQAQGEGTSRVWFDRTDNYTRLLGNPHDAVTIVTAWYDTAVTVGQIRVAVPLILKRLP